MAQGQTLEQVQQTQDLVRRIEGLRENLPEAIKGATRIAWQGRANMLFALVVVIACLTNIVPQPAGAFVQGFFCSVCFVSAAQALIPAEIHLHRVRGIDKQSAADLRKYQDLLRELQKATRADE